MSSTAKDRALIDAHVRHAEMLAKGVPPNAPERLACDAELRELLGTVLIEFTDAKKAAAKAAVDEFFGD